MERERGGAQNMGKKLNLASGEGNFKKGELQAGGNFLYFTLLRALKQLVLCSIG